MSAPVLDASSPPRIVRAVLEAAVWGATSDAARSDFDLNPELKAAASPARRLRPAAVLVPIVDRPNGYSVVLTVRAAHLNAHAGQVAFPGGTVDPSDGSPMATALREAEEEIGLGRDLVETLGAIDRYETGTGFSVTPIVGLVSPRFFPIADDGEVAEVFETPLDFLMDPRNLQRRRLTASNGAVRRFYAYDWGGRLIWGATAGMLKAFSDRIAAARG